MRYDIVKSSTIEGLQENVQRALDDGWEPFGIITERHTGEMCQAIIKESNPSGEDVGELGDFKPTAMI